jgi:hypothetical protein
MRLTTNAFLPASLADFFLYQNPISRYEQRPDAFPPDEQHRKAGAEDQHEHERREEIQVREVARELAVALLVHVRSRVDVNERSDPGDHEDHHR